MQILWDEPKRLKNVEKHGLDFADLDLTFFLSGYVRQSRDGRIKIVGRYRDFAIAVIAKPLGREAVSVISMRRASRAERRHV